MGPGRLVDGPLRRWKEDLINQAGFTRTGDARDTDKDAQGHSHIDVFKVIVPCAPYNNRLFFRRAPCGGRIDTEPAREILAGMRIWIIGDFERGALGDHLAAMNARAGAEVDDIIGGPDGVFVMFDHDDGIAEITQAFKRGDKALVIALVQADTGFIEDVKNPHETGTDLGGQANPLGFAARKRASVTAHGEVIEADIDQETEAFADFFENTRANHFLLGSQSQTREELDGFAHGHTGDIHNGFTGHEHSAGFRSEPGAVAVRAGLGSHVGFNHIARAVGFGFTVAALEVRDYAFEWAPVIHLTALAHIGEIDFFGTGAVQDFVSEWFGQIFPGDMLAFAVVIADGEQRPFIKAIDHTAHVPGLDSAVKDRTFDIGYDQVGVDLHHAANTGTGRACPMGVIEGKHPGCEFFKTDAAVDTGEVFALECFFWIGVTDLAPDADNALSELEAGFHGIGEPLAEAGLDDKPVDDDIDIVFDIPFEVDLFVNGTHFAIDPYADIAHAFNFIEDFLISTFSLAHEGSHQLHFGSFRECEDPVYDALGRLRFDGFAADMAVGFAKTRKQQAEVVIDFRNGADGGTGVSIAPGLVFSTYTDETTANYAAVVDLAANRIVRLNSSGVNLQLIAPTH